MFNREKKGLVQDYLSDRSSENKTNVKKVEKTLESDVKRCEV